MLCVHAAILADQFVSFVILLLEQPFYIINNFTEHIDITVQSRMLFWRYGFRI